ncbi:MAG: anthranilate synthase component I family protein [Bacteroidota bacterium]|nr:anthranilate synthase component I family protein [Bacteroidota bacterium]
MKIPINILSRKIFADQITPISAYLNIRALYPGSILLESSEMDDSRNGHSIICANPIAGITLTKNSLKTYSKSDHQAHAITNDFRIQDELNKFFHSFQISNAFEGINGFFGFQSFEAAGYFETKKAGLCQHIDETLDILNYRLFRYVICFNHFNHEIIFHENLFEDEASTLEKFVPDILNKRSGLFPFRLTSEETSYITNEQFLQNVDKARHHCQVGDVFQMVLSRKYSYTYSGDELNVYRALRHINPSPYMFFFDFGSYKLFGSSPEAQIRIHHQEASLNPIAGTFRRSGNKEEDAAISNLLLSDHKELAEHSMLVDLARNDLNRHCRDVAVAAYRTIKQYSHVIHLSSSVIGTLNPNTNSVEVMADTFPAGTLSGAPKIRAIQLLEEIENDPRGYYGGSIGFIDFQGNINQAIIIRSFFTRQNEIYMRAGAGIVLKSNPLNELQEIDNKLSALRQALTDAQKSML